MKIGEFARLCGTKISVLRHYDKEGLLIPDFTDDFTGYRHYSAGQLTVFMRISALKKAGFSLKEIRDLISKEPDNAQILALIEEKKAYFTAILSNLDEAKRILTKGEPSMKQAEYKIITIPLHKEHPTQHTSISPGSAAALPMEERLYELKTEPVDPAELQNAFRYLNEWAEQQNYQRISGFRTYGTPDSGKIQAGIEVIRLLDGLTPLRENTDIPFENDPTIVGMWEIVGEYMVKDDFYADQFPGEPSIGSKNRVICFLPGGENYWCYGWSKGYLITKNGTDSSLDPYMLENWQGERYMFIEHKSYYYRKGGRPTVLVLRQLDNKAYTREKIARRDNIDLPFLTDASVMGMWHTVARCRVPEEFDPEQLDSGRVFFCRSAEFQENGICTIHYSDGKTHVQKWTKGFVLKTNDRLACAYEIRQIDGSEYLFLQFKNGDYVWGGYEPTYFVLVHR